jgi:uncharacterized protein YbaP (TraB family)
MRTLLVLALLAACSSPANTDRKTGSALPPAEPTEPTRTPGDLLAGSNEPDRELPTAAEVRARIARDCPLVTAPYFFKVEKDGKVGHLLGTRHISVALTKFPKQVLDLLKASDRLVFETDPDDPDVQSPRPQVPVREQLGPALWERLETLVGSDRAALISDESPAAAFVTILIINEDLGARLDDEVIELARRMKIPADGLESHEFQARLLDKLLDLRMLKSTITHVTRKQLETEASTELREYCAGTKTKAGTDEVARAQLKKSGYSDQEIAAIDEMVVYERNRDWIPKIEKLFAQPNVAVVVGAGHLVGDQGVPVLLEKRGYKVTRLTPPN